MLAEQSDHIAVRAPHHILDRRSGDFRQGLLLLDVKQNDRVGSGEQERGGPAVKYVGGLHGALDRLGEVVGQVPDLDRLHDQLYWPVRGSS